MVLTSPGEPTSSVWSCRCLTRTPERITGQAAGQCPCPGSECACILAAAYRLWIGCASAPYRQR
jgi:hypothetical protein